MSLPLVELYTLVVEIEEKVEWLLLESLHLDHLALVRKLDSFVF